MNFQLKNLSPSQLCTEKCDALVVLVSSPLAASRDVLSRLTAQAVQSGDLETGAGQCLSAYRLTGVAATRVVWVGAGDGSAKDVRLAVTKALNLLKTTNAGRVVVSLSSLKGPGAEHAQAAVLACADACYVYSTTVSPPKTPGKACKHMVLAVPLRADVQKGFDKALALVTGMAWAKEWANRPPNYATPTLLAQAAKELGKLPQVSVKVLGPKEVTKLRMGAFLAVAQASNEPLRFIELRYDGGPKSQAPIVLIGKGITFDSGGISLKTATDMDEMKFDMCGAASVLGTFAALAQLQPAINVVGLIPACENMPGGRAVKPGDVVTSMSGQTIEILNTDAEGRLILCDALTYAERFKPRAVVDIATLTGACMVALGDVRSGLFANDDGLAQALTQAGESSLDLCWRLPLDEEYEEGLKTRFADIANVAGRAGGAITAAKFLQRFSTQFAWAHLDIAGTAWKRGQAKGATGRPLPLLLDYLLAQVPVRKKA
jgi:leucyl aminopeptidase